MNTFAYQLRVSLPERDHDPSEAVKIYDSIQQNMFWAEACFNAIHELAITAEGRDQHKRHLFSTIYNLASIGAVLTECSPEAVDNFEECLRTEYDLDAGIEEVLI